MPSKRHAKPTAAQIANRTYRTVLAIERMIENLPAGQAALFSGQAMLSQRIESIAEALRPVIGHCERLVREKETLQRKLDEANKFMTRGNPIAGSRLYPDWKEKMAADIYNKEFQSEFYCHTCKVIHPQGQHSV